MPYEWRPGYQRHPVSAQSRSRIRSRRPRISSVWYQLLNVFEHVVKETDPQLIGT